MGEKGWPRCGSGSCSPAPVHHPEHQQVASSSVISSVSLSVHFSMRQIIFQFICQLSGFANLTSPVSGHPYSHLSLNCNLICHLICPHLCRFISSLICRSICQQTFNLSDSYIDISVSSTGSSSDILFSLSAHLPVGQERP